VWVHTLPLETAVFPRAWTEQSMAASVPEVVLAPSRGDDQGRVGVVSGPWPGRCRDLGGGELLVVYVKREVAGGNTDDGQRHLGHGCSVTALGGTENKKNGCRFGPIVLRAQTEVAIARRTRRPT
jgi:hypothetical protein